jgi:hypothetical protein
MRNGNTLNEKEYNSMIKDNEEIISNDYEQERRKASERQAEGV